MDTASRFGISEDRAANYKADSQGTVLNYEAVSDAIVEFRAESKISSSWKQEIDRDYERRK